MHNWLQDSYPEATVTGTVILSAFTTKLAVYALARGFAGTEILIYIGAAMTAFPVFFAVIENNLRRVLAYSLNNQLGFMVCGIGLGSLAGQLLVGGIGIPSWSEPPLDKFNILHLLELALDMFNILPLMEVAEEGVPVTPPMALRTNWVTLLVSYLFLAGVTAGTVVGLAWFTARMEVQQVLRIGDA